MKQLTTIVFVIGFLFSCSTAEDPIGIDCEDFPESGSVFGYEYEQADINFLNPSYNPFNNNQFVYSKRTTNQEPPFYTHQLRMFDLGTSEDRLICEAFVQFQPAWTNDDWVFFTQGLQVWKVKIDGTNLEMITNNGENSATVFNKSISQVSFYHRVGNDPDQFFYGFYDPQLSTMTDSIYINPDIQVHTVCYDWLNSHKMATVYSPSSSTYGIYTADLQTYQKELYNNIGTVTDGSSIVTAVKVTPDGQNILWASGTGLYRTNIANKECIKLKNSCESVAYITLSLSPDGQTILAERKEQELIAENTIKETYRIVKMNIDGSNEQIIELPE